MPNTPTGGAVPVAQRILAALAGQHVSGPNGDVPVTCSIGITTLAARGASGTNGRSIDPSYFVAVTEKVVGSADAALYEAKRTGGGQVCQGRVIDWPGLPA